MDWDKRPVGQYVHNTCMLTFSNTKNLEQAKKRKKKNQADESQFHYSSVSEVCPPAVAPPAKRFRSSLGVMHDKKKVCLVLQDRIT